MSSSSSNVSSCAWVNLPARTNRSPRRLELASAERTTSISPSEMKTNFEPYSVSTRSVPRYRFSDRVWMIAPSPNSSI